MKLMSIQIEPLVRSALLEDLGGFGDRTSQLLLEPEQTARAAFVVREDGVVAGLDVAALCFSLLNPHLSWTARKQDGDAVRANETLAVVEGCALDILSAERVALNFLMRLSGIASETAAMVAAARASNPHVKVCCTRKTTPGLRLLEKYAVHCGGGHNHRFHLSDGILIKDNHLALNASIEQSVARVRAGVAHLTKIEVEADTIAQVEATIASGADAVLLDNMTPHQLAEAVRLVEGRLITEASGSITLEKVAGVAASGVDIISSGALTHSAVGLDIGLDIIMEGGE